MGYFNWLRRNGIVLLLLTACGGWLVGCEQRTGPVAATPVKKNVPEKAVPAQEVAQEQETAPNAVSFSVPGGGELIMTREVPEQVRVGEEYAYGIRVTNRSERPVSNVVVNEISPGNIEIVSATVEGQEQQQQPPGQQPQAQQQQAQQAQQAQASQQQQAQQTAETPAGPRWQLGTLAPGESKTLRLTGVARAQGALQSCMTLEYEPVLCTQVTAVQPDLQLVRAVIQNGETVNQVYLCDEFAVAYQVSNTGTGTTQPVTISEELPQGIVTPDGNSRIALELEPLQAGETVTRTVPLVAQQAMNFEGYAVAQTGELKARSERGQVAVVRPDIELAVDGPQQEYLGRPVTYQVNVRNPSDVPALATALTVSLPQGIENVSLSTQKAEQKGNQLILGELDPGESRQFQITFDPVQAGKLQSAFTVEAYCADAAKEQIVTRAVGIPAVLLEVVDQVDPVPVGDTTVYTVKVKNQGTAPDMNIQINAQLPQSLELVGAEGDSQVQVSGNQLKFQPIGNLPPGGVAEWNIMARAIQPSKARFNLQLKSDASDKPVTETELTTLY